MTRIRWLAVSTSLRFQYRKRYEVTCDKAGMIINYNRTSFQYRKRYEVTCDKRLEDNEYYCKGGFNTASGMRSHVTIIMKVQMECFYVVSIPQAV